MDPLTEQGSIAEKIEIEQIRTLYESMGSLLAINLLISVCLVFGFRDVIAPQHLTLWMGLMLAMIIIRSAVFLRYRHDFDTRPAKFHQRILLIGSASAGLVWGAGGILLFSPTEFDYQLFLLMALFGMTGGSMFSLSLYLPAYFAYVPATLIPITLQLFVIGGQTHTTLAVVTLVFLGALTSFNIRLNRNFAQSLRLRFENLDLIEQLTEQKAEAERANMAKSKFLAAASHDLRQPLYSLGLFTSVLEEQVDEEKPRTVVGQIRQSLSALENLFNKLLDISQLDAGVVKVSMVDCALEPMFATLAAEFDGMAAEKNLSIAWPEEPLAVHSDPVILEQILRNLIANAINYTDTGSITVSATTSDDTPDRQVTLRISDSGRGIPSAELENIFVEFFQVGNAERDREKGLGLGLSIVRRSAALLGHTLEVESEPGVGSTFQITLEQAHAPISIRTQAARTTPMRRAFSADTVVLVIDDEASVRIGTQQLLELWGCTVVTAENDREGIEQLRKLGTQPTAIVSDFRLRDGANGLQAISAIHAAFHERIPALLITGDIEEQRLQELHSSDYPVVFKPVPPRKLRAFLEGAVLSEGSEGSEDLDASETSASVESK